MPHASRHAILIAGMHRSGTSALARVLNLLGAELGDGLLPPRVDNPRGYWEAADVVALNDECLHHFERSWDDPRPLPEGWSETDWALDWRLRLEALLRDRHGTVSLLAVKDPRIARLLQGWLPVLARLGLTPHVIITLRHPEEVAASLRARGDEMLDPAAAYMLWLRYLLDAEADSRGVSRAVLEYPALLREWRQTLDALAQRFALRWPRDRAEAEPEIAAFLDVGLTRQRAVRLVDASCRALVARCLDLYETLREALPEIPAEPFDVARGRLAADLELVLSTASPERAAPAPVAAADSLWTPGELVPLAACVYFPTPDDRYDEVYSQELLLPPSSAVQHAEFRVSADSQPTRIRFDPAKAPGVYRILALVLNGRSFLATRCQVLAVGGRRLSDGEDGSVRLYAENADPWIEFGLADLLDADERLEALHIAFQRESLVDLEQRDRARLRDAVQQTQAQQMELRDQLDATRQQVAVLGQEVQALEQATQGTRQQMEALSQRMQAAETAQAAAAQVAQLAQRQGEALELAVRTLSRQLEAAQAAQTSVLRGLREAAAAGLLKAWDGRPGSDPPRGGLPLLLRPLNHLQLLARNENDLLRAWASVGGAARFTLRLRGDAVLPPGWYVLRISLQSAQGELARTRLLADPGSGSGASSEYALALTPGTLRQRLLLHFPAPQRELILEPAAGDPHAEFLLGCRPSLRRVSRLEVLLRLGLPAVRRYRALGAGWADVWRETRKALKRGPATAALSLHANAQPQVVVSPSSSSPAPAGSLPPDVQRDHGDYARWVRECDTLDDERRTAIDREIAAMVSPPLISIVLPVYNTAERWLRRCLDSVLAQRYPHWELCIADDASTVEQVPRVLAEYAARDRRIKVVRRKRNGHISAASNSALKLASGQWTALIDHDDELPEDALHEIARAIIEHPDARLIYSDEDKITEDGQRYDPYFKPDWNPELFLSHNMISHLGVYSTALLRELGGFREGFEGSQDYDLAWRVVERTDPAQILHIPRVLYHWRAIRGSTALATGEKNYAAVSALKAVREHLQRTGSAAQVSIAEHGYHRIRYPLPEPPPLVSLIVPTRDRVDLLRMSVGSILEKTRYPAFEVLVVDNQSSDPETLAWFEDVSAADSRVRVLRFDQAFNFSRINNFAVERAHGDLIGLVNNDIEVTDGQWLHEMAVQALRKEVGAVGAKLYYPDGRIQHAGVIVGYLGVAGHAYCGKPRDYPGQMGRALLAQNFTAVTAACLLVRKSVYQEVGGMNEDLDVAFNDVDFCLRLRAAGYRNVWTPHAELTHHESASRGLEDTPAKQARFASEVQRMLDLWGEALAHDPAYNPNLSVDVEPFLFAAKPRLR